MTNDVASIVQEYVGQLGERGAEDAYHSLVELGTEAVPHLAGCGRSH